MNTLTPVFVASLEASSNGLNMGLNATVNAQSTIWPEKTTEYHIQLVKWTARNLVTKTYLCKRINTWTLEMWLCRDAKVNRQTKVKEYMDITINLGSKV